MGKPTICIGENKDADQLRGNHEADQRLCFRYMDSTIPLLPKYKIFPRGGSYIVSDDFILQGLMGLGIEAYCCVGILTWEE